MAQPARGGPPRNFDNVELHLIPVQGNVYMLIDAGGNITVQVGSEALTGFSLERANQVSTNTSASASATPACGNVAPCISWLNTGAFQQPALGTLGNIGTYNVLGPTFFQFDMALVRQFRIREGKQLELRGEAFNVTNSLRSNNPGFTLSTPSTFGRILSAQDPRIMQVAAKFVF